MVISLQLVLLMKNALHDTSMYSNSSIVFIHVSNLLRYWSKQRDTTNVYQELTENVWTCIHQLIANSITTFKSDSDEENGNASVAKDELEKKLRIHQKIINALKNPMDVKQKKQNRVRFF